MTLELGLSCCMLLFRDSLQHGGTSLPPCCNPDPDPDTVDTLLWCRAVSGPASALRKSGWSGRSCTSGGSLSRVRSFASGTPLYPCYRHTLLFIFLMEGKTGLHRTDHVCFSGLSCCALSAVLCSGLHAEVARPHL